MWGHLQVSFCWYLVFIQYRVFPSGQNTSKSAARRKCLFYNYLLLRFKFDCLKRTVPWCDQWSPYFIFPLQLLPAMLNDVQDHLWESMFHIIQVSIITSFYMLLLCCSHRSNLRTVCEEAKPTYHGYGTPKCHQEPKQDCKQVFFLTLQANLTNCHSMAVKTVSTSNCWCYISKQVAKQTPSESCKQVKMINTEAQVSMTRII